MNRYAVLAAFDLPKIAAVKVCKRCKHFLAELFFHPSVAYGIAKSKKHWIAAMF